MFQPSLLSAWTMTFVLTFLAAVGFYVSMLAPLEAQSRALVAAVAIVLDWIPVAAGWMQLGTDPSAVLWWTHMGFGVVGYAILGYCLLGWVRDRSRGLRVRLAFLVIWTPAYLAGIGMALTAPNGL